MTGQILFINAIVLLVYMTLWFLTARARKRLDTVDTAWGLGFVVVAWSVMIQQASWRSFVVAFIVTLWGVRLANHIAKRSKGRDEDPRYKAMAEKWKGNYWVTAYYSIFLLQGFLIWVVSLPIVMTAGNASDNLAWLTQLGGFIWLVGFIIEAKADMQLAAYLRLAKKPKVLQTGLWRYSRHPNYFGELVQWWGIGVIALQAHNGWIGLIGPLTLTILIVFVSGIPPIEKRRAKDQAYRAYQKNTSVLIPFFPRE